MGMPYLLLLPNFRRQSLSAIALVVAGTRFPPSYLASFRVARIEAAIRSTRLRPSSVEAV